jgi:hypothetical protein
MLFSSCVVVTIDFNKLLYMMRSDNQTFQSFARVEDAIKGRVKINNFY